MSDSLDELTESGQLEEHAPRVLAQLRRATAAVLSRMPNPVQRPIDLAGALGLDRSLAWKLWQVARGEGQIPSPKHIPGRSGYRIFADAAVQRGVDSALVTEARDAFDAFHRLGRAHAADRASMDILLGRFTAEGRSRHETALRRDMFRAQSDLLGVQARALLQIAVIYPDDQKGFMPQVALAKGHYGLQRTRKDAIWPVSQSTLVQAAGPNATHRRSTLGGGADASGASPLIVEFCSRPTPDVRRRLTDEYMYEDELMPGPIGQAYATDIVLGERVSSIPWEATDHDAITMRVRTPNEHLCCDLWLHERVASAAPVELEFYTLVNNPLPYARGDKRDRIPLREVISERGRGDRAAPAPEIPRHAELVDWVLNRVGQPASEFRVYRVQMRYAPIPICLTMTYGLRQGEE